MYMYISLDMTGARSCGSLKVRKRFIAVHTCMYIYGCLREASLWDCAIVYVQVHTDTYDTYI